MVYLFQQFTNTLNTFKIERIVYSKFKSRLLGIGSGSQENKMELWSKKLTVIPFGGGVFVALSEGRWIKDRSKLWNVVLEKTKSRELKYKQMRRAVLGSWRSRHIVIRKSNLRVG